MIIQVDLEQEEIDLIIQTLLDRRSDLDVILKEEKGLEAETMRNILIQSRDINNIIRELQYFVKRIAETEAPGPFDDNNYFESEHPEEKRIKYYKDEAEVEHLAEELKQIDKNVSEQQNNEV